jgi:hypothetical protein
LKRKASSLNRRDFLATITAAAASLSSSCAIAATARKPRSGSSLIADRSARVYAARVKAAQYQRDQTVPASVSNGDEERYPGRWGSFTKALAHDAAGDVQPDAYRIYLEAIRGSDSAAYERIPLGGYLKLANPQAAYSFDLVGPDSAALSMATPPALASAEQASELAEMYWHALLRDVPFAQYETNPLVAKAAAELSRMSDFRGPKESGSVTPGTIFRGTSRGGRRGPYISQFLLRDIPMTPIRVPQRNRTAVAGRDYMTSFEEWLGIQNGGLYGVNTFDDTLRYIRTGRDLAEWVHRDFTYQSGLFAALMLMKMSAPLDGSIPYQYSITQGGFVTFGASDILHLVSTVANLVLKGAWYQKWLVHRRARPEELGGRVHMRLGGRNEIPLHRDIVESEAVQLVHQRHGSWLLPQAYPEAAPSHPSYPAGHAVIAGACSTILKACFAETWVLPQSVLPSPDGTTLQPYKETELTVAGELDKLAENIAVGRNFAGIHWRSDAIEGIRMGEEFAIKFLREAKITSSSEFFHGFSLTTYDGATITI